MADGGALVRKLPLERIKRSRFGHNSGSLRNGPTPEFWHEVVRLALTCGHTRREIVEAFCILFPQPRLHKRSKINAREAIIRSTFDKKRIEAETASLHLVFDARHTLDLPDEQQAALETDLSTLMV